MSSRSVFALALAFASVAQAGDAPLKESDFTQPSCFVELSNSAYTYTQARIHDSTNRNANGIYTLIWNAESGKAEVDGIERKDAPELFAILDAAGGLSGRSNGYVKFDANRKRIKICSVYAE